MKTTRRLLLVSAAILGALGAPAMAFADEYPSKPITLVVLIFT